MTELHEDRLAELMVKVVDGVASPAETEELMSHVIDKPELRAELDGQRAIKATTDGWMARLQADLAADHDRTSTSRRGVRGLGVLLLLAGFAILTGWPLSELFLADDVPFWMKTGTALSCAGAILLTAHMIWTRFLSGTADPYDEVIR